MVVEAVAERVRSSDPRCVRRREERFTLEPCGARVLDAEALGVDLHDVLVTGIRDPERVAADGNPGWLVPHGDLVDDRVSGGIDHTDGVRIDSQSRTSRGVAVERVDDRDGGEDRDCGQDRGGPCRDQPPLW
jgi:hypothetical protein